jgi:hypothetical protein
VFPPAGSLGLSLSLCHSTYYLSVLGSTMSGRRVFPKLCVNFKTEAAGFMKRVG